MPKLELTAGTISYEDTGEPGHVWSRNLEEAEEWYEFRTPGEPDNTAHPYSTRKQQRHLIRRPMPICPANAAESVSAGQDPLDVQTFRPGPVPSGQSVRRL
jgi:hypothetical protein